VRRERSEDGRVAPKGRTRYFLFQPSLPLSQATLVRGAFVLQARARPARLIAVIHKHLCLKRFKHKYILSSTKCQAAIVGQMGPFPIRIWGYGPSAGFESHARDGPKGRQKGRQEGSEGANGHAYSGATNRDCSEGREGKMGKGQEETQTLLVVQPPCNTPGSSRPECRGRVATGP
jgi:hypothetical protein